MVWVTPPAVVMTEGSEQGIEWVKKLTTTRTPADVTLSSEVKVTVRVVWVAVMAGGTPNPLRLSNCGELVDGPSNTRKKSKFGSVLKAVKVSAGRWPAGAVTVQVHDC